MTAPLVGVAIAGVLVLLGCRPTLRRHPGRVAAPATLRASVEVLGARSVVLLERAIPGLRGGRRDRQLPDALDRLASSIRAGEAIGPALVALAPTLPEPLGADLRPVAAALTHGAPVPRALGAWAQQPGASADVRLVVAALTLGADAGGQVARAVDRISAALRERAELRGEVRSLATQARASAALLAVAPPAFTVVVAGVEPAAAGFLLSTPAGMACLGAGLGLEVAGAAWMARITRSVT